MNFENLKSMPREQLLQLAGTQGLKVHPRAKDATIVKQIMEAALTPQKAPLQHQAAKPTVPEHRNTPDEVEAAIASIKERVPAFESIYDSNENTWHFRCKGAEECGNLNIPMRVIVMKAQNVSRGKLVMMGLNEYFDRTSAGGQSAYTNTVIAG